MRLIDADLLPKYDGYALSASEIANAVESAPTVDAEPIVHAHWDDRIVENVFSSTGYAHDIICSNCYTRFIVTENAFSHEKFCRNCGAKMDEVVK